MSVIWLCGVICALNGAVSQEKPAPFTRQERSSEISKSPALSVEVGADRLFEPRYVQLIQGKRVGLVTNQTGVARNLERTLDLFERWHAAKKLTLVAVFAPEHGLTGDVLAGKEVPSLTTEHGIPVRSLFGATRRPTQEMLKGIDTLVYDIQDIGSRSYTFASTLYYVMEAAAKERIRVVVLDRPNPLGGELVDGPMLEDGYRSFVGYINVPYCHGMTIGELARFFNGEYRIGCDLEVVPMRGWSRSMRFETTGLPWIPTSPNVPESSTPFFYPTTGLLGELGCASIGGGYTLPFKIVVAPWVDKKAFAKKLNRGAPPGVRFQETCVRPFLGAYSGQACGGVLIVVTDWSRYNPILTQYWIFDALRQLYPDQFVKALTALNKERLGLFFRLCGTRAVYDILVHERAPFSKLVAVHGEQRKAFLSVRQKYLIASYSARP